MKNSKCVIFGCDLEVRDRNACVRLHCYQEVLSNLALYIVTLVLMATLVKVCASGAILADDPKQAKSSGMASGQKELEKDSARQNDCVSSHDELNTGQKWSRVKS